MTSYRHFQSEPKCWFYTGKTGTRIDHRRYIPIDIFAKKLRKPLIAALPAAHALTRCDTTTALSYIGKKTVSASLNKMELKHLANLATFDSKSALEVVSNFLCCMIHQKNQYNQFEIP